MWQSATPTNIDELWDERSRLQYEEQYFCGQCPQSRLPIYEQFCDPEDGPCSKKAEYRELRWRLEQLERDIEKEEFEDEFDKTTVRA
jgi:hypothetical protein